MSYHTAAELTEFVKTLKPYQHKPVKISDVQLVSKQMELTQPFETSFGRFASMEKIYVKLTLTNESGDSFVGVGECTPLPYPWYDGESDVTVRAVLDSYIVPALKQFTGEISSVTDVMKIYGAIVGHNMAKTGVEGAYWDAIGKMEGRPVSKLWGETRDEVETGTSVGLEKTDELIIEKVDLAVGLNVKRVKIKIKPGRDVELVKAIRAKYPDLIVQVDGNAAYDLQNPEHVRLLTELDQFNLLMVEQPGPNDDRYYHSLLSQEVKTPLCLDESILNVRHAIETIEMWSKQDLLSRLIINIKPPRVGGFWESVKIAKVCEQVGVPVWCGGMLESALGKTCNVHFSSLSSVNLPGDHISQVPYYKQDVGESPQYHDGMIRVPTGAGWGVEVTV